MNNSNGRISITTLCVNWLHLPQSWKLQINTCNDSWAAYCMGANCMASNLTSGQIMRSYFVQAARHHNHMAIDALEMATGLCMIITKSCVTK